MKTKHVNFMSRPLIVMSLVLSSIGHSATFTDANWVNLGVAPSVNGTVLATAVDAAGNLYIGGQFTRAGGIGATNIAKWNGNSWSALGSGISGSGDGFGSSVQTLTLSGTNLYVGGDFAIAGGVVATNIACWNGSSWSALGSGISSPGSGQGASVMALAVLGTNVIAGGNFTVAGGVATTNIAQWNGNSWSALGSSSGMQYDFVAALAVAGTNLYAAGWFQTAGGVAANNIAKWNGSNWSALSSGILGKGAHNHGPTVFALAASGTNLYVGGDFSTAGGVAANDIAQWNGSGWSALGSGVNNDVFALAVDVSSNLYVGGEFTKAGSGIATEIARWNGSTWSALGSGMDSGQAVTNDIYGLAVDFVGNLYAGGDFTKAGTNASPYVAEALFALLPQPFFIVTTNGGFGHLNNQFQFTLLGPAGSNVVISASTNLQTWVPVTTNPLGAGSLTFTDTLATNYLTRYYRATLRP